MTLVEFLTARLDEDEAAAVSAGGDTWQQGTRQYETNVVRPRGGFDWVGVTGRRLDLDPVLTGQTSNTERALWEGRAAHIARHDPARVLADVDAKRRIVALHSGWHECPDFTGDEDMPTRTVLIVPPDDTFPPAAGFDRTPCMTNRLLASEFADHPDYDESWKP